MFQTSIFMAVGGRDPKILVCNLMRKIVLDEVAEKYSLTGKTTKQGLLKGSFEKTEAYKLILGELLYYHIESLYTLFMFCTLFFV